MKFQISSERKSELGAKFVLQILTAEERHELEQWLSSSPEDKKAFDYATSREVVAARLAHLKDITKPKYVKKQWKKVRARLRAMEAENGDIKKSRTNTMSVIIAKIRTFFKK